MLFVTRVTLCPNLIAKVLEAHMLDEYFQMMGSSWLDFSLYFSFLVECEKSL
jgi:hypothetical protein